MLRTWVLIRYLNRDCGKGQLMMTSCVVPRLANSSTLKFPTVQSGLLSSTVPPYVSGVMRLIAVRQSAAAVHFGGFYYGEL